MHLLPATQLTVHLFLASSVSINGSIEPFLATGIESGRTDAGSVNQLTSHVKANVRIDGETRTNAGDTGDNTGQT